MIIRACLENDLTAIVQLTERLAETPLIDHRLDDKAFVEFQRECLLKDWESGASQVLVAEKDGDLVGFIESVVSKDWVTQQTQLYISRLVVAADAEGSGVGNALLHQVEQTALSEGISRLSLNVFAENAPAIRFYQRQGWLIETHQLFKWIGGDE